MKPEPDYDAEMRLPAGKTCDDCPSTRRCNLLGYTSPGSTSCDFWPTRFYELTYEEFSDDR